MNKRQFVRARRPEWEKFRKLLERADTRSTKRLSSDDIEDYSRLLREVSNDLATIRSREWGRELEQFLNHLVTRGFNGFYAAPPGRIREFFHFAAIGFPRLLRQNGWYFLAAWCCFFIPFIVSWIVVQFDPNAASAILPAAQLESIEEMYQSVADDNNAVEGEDGEDEQAKPFVEGFGDQRAMAAGFYVRHNVGISFLCFASGILLGVGSLYFLLSNGIVLGAVAGYLVGKGLGDTILSFAVTHGSFELTAITISGAAGLMLGDAILHRGNRRFRDALKTRGLVAVKIAFGAGLMLVVAAGIEAFWSPAPIPSFVKYSVGLSSWVFVYAWLLLAGRGATE